MYMYMVHMYMSLSSNIPGRHCTGDRRREGEGERERERGRGGVGKKE